MTLISALRQDVSTSRRALTIALTIDGGFGRIRAVPGGRKSNEFAISGLFGDACQVCKTSTPGSNPGGASNFLKESEAHRSAGCRSSGHCAQIVPVTIESGGFFGGVRL
jgi:hypothetical protein